MSDLKIAERHYKTVTILDLAGKIRLGDGNTVLRSSLREAGEAGKNNILLNLAEVSHIDSSGLGELIAGFVSAQKKGGELKLLGLTPRIREVMVMTKLLTVFDVFEDEAAAVSSFQIPSDNDEEQQSDFITGELNKSSAVV